MQRKEPYIEMPIEIKIGEVWYVKIPGNITLSTMMIIYLTEKTVALDHAIWNEDTEEYEPYSKQYNTDLLNHYKITDIEFVERAK